MFGECIIVSEVLRSLPCRKPCGKPLREATPFLDTLAEIFPLHSLKLTFSPLKMVVSNRNLLFQWSIFRGYVSLREGNVTSLIQKYLIICFWVSVLSLSFCARYAKQLIFRVNTPIPCSIQQFILITVLCKPLIVFLDILQT